MKSCNMSIACQNQCVLSLPKSKTYRCTAVSDLMLHMTLTTSRSAFAERGCYALRFGRADLAIDPKHNKSLDRSGGCAFCIITIRRGLDIIAAPDQLSRSALRNSATLD